MMPGSMEMHFSAAATAMENRIMSAIRHTAAVSYIKFLT